MQVPIQPSIPTLSQVASGVAPHSADTWLPIASMANYLRGVGGQQVCGYAPNLVLEAEDAVTLTHRVSQRESNPFRVWVVHMIRVYPNVESPLSIAHGTIVAGSSTLTFQFTSRRQTLYITESTTPSGDVDSADINISLSANSGDVMVSYVACFETPRVTLPAAQGGVARDSMNSNRPIYDESGVSVTAAAKSIDGAISSARRSTLYHWSVGEETDEEFSSSTTAWVDVLTLRPTILQRKLYEGQTVAPVSVRVEGRGAFEVRLTMESGDSTTLTVVGSSTTYASDSGTIDVDVEDPSQDDGRRSGRHDEMRIEARATNITVPICIIREISVYSED